MSLTFLGNEGLVKIPFFQRSYVWNKSIWGVLQLDIGFLNCRHRFKSLLQYYSFHSRENDLRQIKLKITKFDNLDLNVK